MKQLEISSLTENFFEAIGKEWMLVTAGNPSNFNTMTASWGGVGILWNKPVAFVFIRPERYTDTFVMESDELTLTFLGAENRGVHAICGKKSGRDIDKIEAAGLKPIFTPEGHISFEQARLTLACKKLYMSELTADSFIDKSLIDTWYGGTHGNFHKLYVVEITAAWEGAL